MANLEVLALDEATPQIRAPGSGDGYTMPRPLTGASNVLDIRNSTSGQTVNVFNTYTDASNYESGFVRWSSNVLEIGSTAAGTGTDRDVKIKAGTSSWTFSTNSGSSFPGNIVSPNFSLQTQGSGLYLRNGSITGGCALTMQEMTAPSAPSENFVHIYSQDNGAGKTQLMALFATGAAQQIAIEP